MAMLKKEESIFVRDAGGNLLPIMVELKDIEDKPTIRAIPLTHGDFTEITALRDDKEAGKKNDDKIILTHCVEPKFDEKDLAFMKPSLRGAILSAIISTSVSNETIKSTTEIKDEGDFLSRSSLGKNVA
jgi:hypothetical protein